MKKIKIKCEKSPFMVYLESLKASGYSFPYSTSKYSHYRKLINQLVKEYPDDWKRRIGLMVKHYEEIKEEFTYKSSTKLPFPHPKIFFDDEIYGFVKSLSQNILVLKYLPELVDTFMEAVENEDLEIFEKMKKEGRYGRKEIIGSVFKAYQELGRAPDDFLRAVLHLFK